MDAQQAIDPDERDRQMAAVNEMIERDKRWLEWIRAGGGDFPTGYAELLVTLLSAEIEHMEEIKRQPDKLADVPIEQLSATKPAEGEANSANTEIG
jgi:hypothetical protein